MHIAYVSRPHPSSHLSRRLAHFDHHGVAPLAPVKRDSFNGKFGEITVIAPSLPATTARPEQVLVEITPDMAGVKLVASFDERCRARTFCCASESDGRTIFVRLSNEPRSFMRGWMIFTGQCRSRGFAWECGLGSRRFLFRIMIMSSSGGSCSRISRGGSALKWGFIRGFTSGSAAGA